MAVMKKSTRKKLSKQLNKLIKQHGAEMALALVTGIVGALASERANKPAKKSKSSKAGQGREGREAGEGAGEDRDRPQAFLTRRREPGRSWLPRKPPPHERRRASGPSADGGKPLRRPSVCRRPRPAM